MAKKRMFSLQIVDTDAFLDMPASSQLLYFHLTMRADDEGFVGNPKKIMRLIGVQEDDMKVLIAKRFILTFNSGIIVIKHWLIHNSIRMDRFNKTTYQDEKKTLKLKINRSYTNERQPNGNQLATQVKLSKVNLSKDKLDIAGKPAEIIPDLLKDKQRHIQIIGLFAKAKKIVFTSKEHQGVFIRRNLRAARDLMAYPDEKIIETMQYLILNTKIDWKLETVGKYVDEMDLLV